MIILIKGMKMPDCCWNCPCLEGEYGKCNISRKPIKSDKGRLADCPLIELPDHGDLIDESERVDVQYYDDEFGEWSIKTKTVGEAFAEMCEVPPKVVIQAERSEE